MYNSGGMASQERKIQIVKINDKKIFSDTLAKLKSA